MHVVVRISTCFMGQRWSSMNLLHRGLLVAFFRSFSTCGKGTMKDSNVSPLLTPEINRKTFVKELVEREELSVQEWEKVFEDLRNTRGPIGKDSMPSVLMKEFYKTGNFPLAKSFWNFLTASRSDVHWYTMVYYFCVLCSAESFTGESELLSLFDKIMKEDHFIDPVTTFHLVKGLCNTSLWHKAYEVLQKRDALETGVLNTEAFSCLAATSFKKGNSELAWQLVSQLLDCGCSPNGAVYEECFQMVLGLQSKGEMKKAQDNATRILKILEKLEFIPMQTFAELVAQYFRNLDQKWNVSFTDTQRTGNCCTCHHSLESGILSPAQYETLRDAFMERVFKGSDIFLNSAPKELDAFEEFIKLNAPFDAVFDGLNISYMFKRNVPGKVGTSLIMLIDHLQKAGKNKILIIGRKHMLRWPKQVLNSIKRNAFCFFVDNVSKDDVFLLYASLASGQNTCFISNDLLHNHGTKLNDHYFENLYSRWRRFHQIHLFRAGNGFRLKGPQRHIIKVQGDFKTGWHIPYRTDEELGPFDFPDNWLCVRRKIKT